MRIVLLCVFVIELLGLSFGQTPKQIRFDNIYQPIQFSQATVINNKYYTLGQAGGNAYSTSRFYKQDRNLVIEDELGIYRGVWGTGNKTESFNGLCSTPDNHILTAGSIGLENQHDVWVVKMDTSANLIWDRSIQISVNQAWTTLIPNNIGGALVIATEFPNPGQINVHLYNFDSFGDTLWTRKLTRSNGDDLSQPQGAYQKSNGNYIILVGGGLTELDSNGDVIDVNTFDTNDGKSIVFQSCYYVDNYAYLAGKVFDWGTGISVACIMKLDNNNDVVWAKSYPEFTSMVNINVSDNGEILGLGSGFLPYYVPIIKLTNFGNPILGRTFGNIPYFSGISHILSHEDHYFLNGGTSGFGSSYGYQVLADTNLNSNSCYQSTLNFTSSILSIIKQQGQAIDSYSLFSEIDYFGSDPITVQSGINNSSLYIQTELDGSLSTSYDVFGDDCGGNCIGSITMTPSSGNPAYTYLWADGTTNAQNSGFCFGDSVVVRTGDQSGCYIYDTIVIPQMTPVNDLCLVTVDSTSTKNEVIWEKPISGAIDGFVVHREVTGNYTVVGYVPYDSLSRFIDNTNGVNPNITSYRYKITTLDTCGYESEYSDYHETIHLTVNQGAGIQTNLIWDGYEGFSFSYNRIWKDSLGDDNWVLRDSVSSSVFTWTDIYASTVATEYLIEVVSPSICTAAKAQDYGSTRSNKSTIAGPPAELGLEEMAAIDFTVFPNPSGSFFTLKHNSIDKMNLFIYDNQGRLVKSFGINDLTTIIEIPDLETGVYILQVVSGGIIRTQKLIKK
ncbi:MAG: T9SS type A sorting domain-containing protein [Flavobacteriales bacterium]|nr:T9SS type A sorting domain-containing protein [Flavobacteriales bacterium]MCB9197689.1 T9SS type A sorting domain-containing protein [Flavobacteriales bacterium]